MDRTSSIVAMMLVEPGTKKSKTETWGRIDGVGEVVLLSVAMLGYVAWARQEKPNSEYMRQ
jgi:hypothetical protein